MKKLPQSVQRLIDNFSKLPGVGPKSASRMAFFILQSSKDQALDFASTIQEIKEKIVFCEQCHNLSEENLCLICVDTNRDSKKIMIVEDILDLLAFENTDSYDGVYHVLGGVISPLNGIGPEELNIPSLLKRLSSFVGEAEVIIATNPTLEGEATAMYLKQELSLKDDLSITRIARGVPSGADLDYADKSTLTRALDGRSTL